MTSIRALSISLQRFLTANSSVSSAEELENYFMHHYMNLNPIPLEKIFLNLSDRNLKIDQEYKELNFKLENFLENFKEPENHPKMLQKLNIKLAPPSTSTLARKRFSVVDNLALR